MSIYNEFNKKEKPVFTGLKFGFGRGPAEEDAGPAFENTGEYLYLPFNETSSTRTKFGNYASSITINAGGGAQSDHPYTITDTTYNSGSNYSHHCNGQTDTAYLDANTKLGSVGTGDLCMDFYYKWIAEGNGGGSYGYVGDYSRGSSQLYPSHTGISDTDYLGLGAINTNVIGVAYYGGTQIQYNASLTTNGSGMNVWYHVLVLRQSNKWYSFIDGVLDGYYAESSPRNIANGGGFHFGTIDRGGHWWDARVADFMWQKGDDAFYTIDSSVGSSDIGTTYFTKPQYKNKKTAISSNSDFSVVKAPTGFTYS